MKNMDKYAAIPTGQYDLGMLEEMEDNEYMLEVLTIWLMESPKDIKDMQEALKDNKIDVVCKKAHKFKSSAGVIQAEKLRLMLEDIELKGKGGAAALELHELIGLVIHEYESIEYSLKVYMEGLHKKIA